MDVKVPGMVYAIVERCPVMGGKLISVDNTAALKVPGVIKVVSYEGTGAPMNVHAGVAVVANNTWSAIKARKLLKIKWDEGSNNKDNTVELFKRFAAKAKGKPEKQVYKKGVTSTSIPTVNTLSATYSGPLLAHAAIEPVNCIAEVKDKNAAVWIAFILGILIAFLLWSIYFDMTSEQETKQGYKYLQWLIFLHFPLLASLSVLGACIKVLLVDMHAYLHLNVQWMFCAAIATMLFMTVCIAALMKEEEEDRSYIRPVSKLLIVTGIIVLLIPFFGHYLNTLFFLSIISLILFVPVFVGIRSWVRYKFFSRH